MTGDPFVARAVSEPGVLEHGGGVCAGACATASVILALHFRQYGAVPFQMLFVTGYVAIGIVFPSTDAECVAEGAWRGRGRIRPAGRGLPCAGDAGGRRRIGRVARGVAGIALSFENRGTAAASHDSG